MKISYTWLKQYIKTDLRPEKLSEILTDCGLEVESLETFEAVKGGLHGIVTGLIKTKEPHPNADRLNITTVDIGTGTDLHIVCGAANVAVGQKVFVATIGATIYPPEGASFKIKESKIRGALSQGMICAEDELGLGCSHEGILVLDEGTPIGLPAAQHLKIENDLVFEIGLTPNRTDAMSHYGVARDLAAAINCSAASKDEAHYHLPSVVNFPHATEQAGPVVEINDPACIRYSGITIKNVQVKESPEWLKNRLKAIGLKPINNIVDITNFVLHESGQPLHAFDLRAISGNKVTVKKLPKGTKFKSLDGVDRILTGTELMICNAESPMCMAGIYGGLDSGVQPTTQDIFLESACFNAVSIRKSSKHHNLKTDASFRFERGTDPNNTIYALKRAVLLILEIAGGKIASELFDCYPVPVSDFKIRLNFEYVHRLIGVPLDKTVIKKILVALEIKIDQESATHLDLSVPPFKNDVQREADVVEEILRIYGYNNIPIPSQLHCAITNPEKPDKELIRNSVCDFLSNNGFFETMSLSLTKSTYTESHPALFQPEKNIQLLNPLSTDLNAMRQTMIFSGLEVLSYNRNRRNPDLKMYEFGKTYHKEGGRYKEYTHLSIFIVGKSHEDSWNKPGKPVDFYTLKSVVECLLKKLGIQNHKAAPLIPGIFSEGLQLRLNNTVVVDYGLVNPQLYKHFDITEPVYHASFNWEEVINALSQKDVKYSEVPKYPEVRRDLALLLDRSCTYAELESLAFNTEKNLLKKVHLFDVYEGDKIAPDKKSYAMSFILQDETKTLNDKQIDKSMERLIESFEKNLNASVRK